MKTTILILVSLVVSACFHNVNGPDDKLSGNYSAYNSSGILILQGQINITVKKDSTITGNWEIYWVPGVDTSLPIGPQVGTGRLIGDIVDGDLMLGLNPDMFDNNVNLHGLWSAKMVQGTWHWSGFMGIIASGSFRLQF